MLLTVSACSPTHVFAPEADIDALVRLNYVFRIIFHKEKPRREKAKSLFMETCG